MRSGETPGSGDAPGPVPAPAGPIVGLVMTDIEGSTYLWERVPAAMARALQEHNAIARTHLQIHGGYEIKTEGDSFALAFSEPLLALLWCLDVTDALARQAWPQELRGADERVGLRMRMGLHVGEPIRVADPVTGRTDFLGPVMNRAARVSAAGHGGQVLLSDAAWTALAGALPEGLVEIEDLGLYTLRGLNTPERLRLVRRASQTRSRFPPLRAARWRPNSPLAGRDQFVGRAADLAAIHHHLSSGVRLLTLKGPGGTGKTRLARRYGAEQDAFWMGGVVFCDLTEARTGEAVVAAAVRALELASGSGDPQIAAALAGRGAVLLILDNLEQVSEEAAPHLERWLETPGPAALLVTSRIPLRLPVEVVLPLAPLSLPDVHALAPEDLLASEAAELFIERAMERGAALTLGPQTCADIANLVRRLDGLPLAIELAAAWSRLLSPASLLDRVAKHQDPLRRSGDGRVARQSTLRAVVEWSWALLQPWEQAAFAQLSVFEGGFSVEAAEAVVDLSAHPDAPHLAAVLEQLVDHSLVHRAEQRGRLVLLVTLQDFAAERLNLCPPPTDRAGAERRHGRAIIGLIQRMEQSTPHSHVAQGLKAERENLLVATRRAVLADDAEVAWRVGLVAVDLLVLTGPQSEAVQLARSILRTRGLTPSWRASVSVALGEALRNVGQTAEAEEHLERGLAALDGEEQGRHALRALRGLGVLAHDRRDLPLARVRYQTALDRAERSGASTERAMILTCLGHLEREVGDYLASEKRFRDALAWCPPEDVWTRWHALGALALLQLDRGRTAEASKILRDVLVRARDDGDRVSEVVAAGNLAGALAELGELDEALALQQRNIAMVRALGNQRLVALNLGNYGDILLQVGRLEEAELMLRESVTLARANGLRDAEGAFRGTLAEVHHRRGATDRAWAELEEGAALLAAIPNPLELMRVRCRQIRVARADARPVEQLVQEVLSLYHKLGIEPDSAQGREVAELTAR